MHSFTTVSQNTRRWNGNIHKFMNSTYGLKVELTYRNLRIKQYCVNLHHNIHCRIQTLYSIIIWNSYVKKNQIAGEINLSLALSLSPNIHHISITEDMIQKMFTLDNSHKEM